MDPNGENLIVDTHSKEANKLDASTHEKEEQQHQQQDAQKQEEGDEGKDNVVVEEKNTPQLEQDPQVLPSSQGEQEPAAAATKPEEKDQENKDKETTSEKEKEKDPQPSSKTWKNNTRKKKNKDEIRDFAQWPTLQQAVQGTTSKKAHPESTRNTPKLDREKQSRTRRGINWKPLATQGNEREQQQHQQHSSPSATSGEGEQASSTQASTSASAGSGRGYQGSYPRGQPKRRGGRGGPWPRASSQTANTPQEGASESGAGVSETEGKEDSQLAQTSQDSAAGSSNGGAGGNPSGESRRYRGSSRGPSSRPSSSRWRGNFRPSYYNRYNNAPGRGGQPPYAPLRLPQDPDQFNEQIKRQIEYYFGIDNLCRDIYLRKNMNNEGWISLNLISNFNRVRDLKIEIPRMVEALKDSQVVEVKDECIRRRDDWARWTFPPRVDVTSQTQSSTPQPQETSTAAIETHDQ